MPLNTIKFSGFAAQNLTYSSNMAVGVGNGANYQGPAVITWSTATRPSAPYNGLLGLNTDLEEYEYWNGNTHLWVQLQSSTNNLIWNNVITTSASMMEGNGYVANNAGQVVLTLPSVCAFGQLVSVCGYGSGGWTIVFNAGQNLVFGKDIATTSSGSLTSSNQFDQVELLCVVANTTFIVRNVQGNLSIV